MEAGLGGQDVGKEQRWANQGWLSPFTRPLPLAIRMEGNTVDIGPRSDP